MSTINNDLVEKKINEILKKIDFEILKINPKKGVYFNIFIIIIHFYISR